MQNARVPTKDTIELMNFLPPNFRRLVLGGIDSYDSESRRIFKHFSRSTWLLILCTAQISKFQKNRPTFWWNERMFFFPKDLSFGFLWCLSVCLFECVSEWVWSYSRFVGWVTGCHRRRSRRTHVGRRCPHQVSPPGVPTMCPDRVPRPCPAQTFLYHLFLLWKSINGRFSNKESVVGGQSWWKWPFSLSKMHFALDFFNHFMMGAILMKMVVFLK